MSLGVGQSNTDRASGLEDEQGSFTCVSLCLAAILPLVWMMFCWWGQMRISTMSLSTSCWGRAGGGACCCGWDWTRSLRSRVLLWNTGTSTQGWQRTSKNYQSAFLVTVCRYCKPLDNHCWCSTASGARVYCWSLFYIILNLISLGWIKQDIWRLLHWHFIDHVIDWENSQHTAW